MITYMRFVFLKARRALILVIIYRTLNIQIFISWPILKVIYLSYKPPKTESYFDKTSIHHYESN